MIKQQTVFFVLFLLGVSAFAQNQKIDSLDRLAFKASSDTQRINLYMQKAKALFGYNHDSAIALDSRLIEESKKINYYRGELDARSQLSSDYSLTGNFSAALEQLTAMRKMIKPSPDSLDFGTYYSIYGLYYSLQGKYDSAILLFERSIKMIEANNIYTNTLGNDYNNIAIAYQQLSNFPVALSYYQKILKIAEQQKNETDAAYAYVNMAQVFSSLGKNKEAEETFVKSIALAKKNELRDVELYSYLNLASLLVEKKEWQQCYDLCMKAADLGAKLGDKASVASSLSRASIALAKRNQFDSALTLNARAIPIADSSAQALNIYQVYTDRANILRMMGRIKEAIAFYEKGFSTMKSGDFYGGDFAAHYKELSECYEKEGDYAKALYAGRKGFMINDSVRNKDNGQKSTELAMNYEFDKKQQLAKLEQDKKDAVAKRAKLIQYFVIAGLAGVVLLVLAIAFIQYKNSKQKQKANLLLERQKQKVEVALTDLKSAQAQLVQSEKMASLGELTAGIAHEIQNPLNFVNNFSEVNKELLEELKEEAEKGNINEIKAIVSDLIENEKKINQHGKRADAIVKGMLQHSKSSIGTKEPTLINTLADEYLRLGYHGLRAKDKNFNASMQTDFDESITKIDIVPQDIGRVLLNLYNNSFYAVNEKHKQHIAGYEPTVSVSTKRNADNVEIKVADNGDGIPDGIINKIFQPFFTTKPTGQGTGLGLSLSYDIIKAHGGELKVSTKDKEGSVFVIILPVKNSGS